MGCVFEFCVIAHCAAKTLEIGLAIAQPIRYGSYATEYHAIFASNYMLQCVESFACRCIFVLFFEPKNPIFAVYLAETAMLGFHACNFGVTQVCMLIIKKCFYISPKLNIVICRKFCLTR